MYFRNQLKITSYIRSQPCSFLKFGNANESDALMLRPQPRIRGTIYPHAFTSQGRDSLGHEDQVHLGAWALGSERAGF